MFVVTLEKPGARMSFIHSPYELAAAIPEAERFNSREAASAEIANVAKNVSHLDTASKFVIYPYLAWNNPNEPTPAES